MKHADRFDEYTKGLKALSVGGYCPGCDECLDLAGYSPVEGGIPWDDREEGWYIPEGETRYETEEEALTAAREAFLEAWSNGSAYHEPSFWRDACDLCGSTLAGDRDLYHYIGDEGGIVHGDNACSDCVLYHCNGDIADDGE